MYIYRYRFQLFGLMSWVFTGHVDTTDCFGRDCQVFFFPAVFGYGSACEHSLKPDLGIRV